MKTSKFIFSIILHVLAMVVFMVLFYFFYIVKIENKMVNKQVDYILDDFDKLLSYLPSKPILKKESEQTTVDNNDDIIVETKNKNLKLQTYNYTAIFLTTGIIVLFLIYYKYKVDLRSVIIHSVIHIGVIMLTYFLFITFIVQQYNSGDPNLVKLAAVNTLHKYLSE